MLPRLFRPPVFQGSIRRRRYFEGWYLKHVAPAGDRIISFIPGISLYPGDRHAFVQYIDSGGGRSGYVRYPLEEFEWDRQRFDVQVGPNRFSAQGLELHLTDGQVEWSGRLVYTDAVPFPSRLLAPGIMGWYSFVPLMECNHGVVSLTHRVEGSLRAGGEELELTGGSGYIEKDWGSSFPEAWLWLQCNSFAAPDASLMVSVANIPWLGRHFVGFLAFFHLQERLYLYTSYNGSSISAFSASSGKAGLQLSGPHGSLAVQARRDASAALESPALGKMSRTIRESVDAEIDVTAADHRGRRLFRGKGVGAGMEVEGDINGLAAAAGYASRPSTG
jgi:hypothetical protein